MTEPKVHKEPRRHILLKRIESRVEALERLLDQERQRRAELTARVVDLERRVFYLEGTGRP